MKRWMERLLGRGEPDLQLTRYDGTPYMRRWWIIPRKNERTNIYLHNIVGDDDDRAFHDHPAWNVSIVLRGGYIELTPEYPNGIWRGPGSIVFRGAEAAHRLRLSPRGAAWSIFISGPKNRVWGFLCGERWVDWKTFTGFKGEHQTGNMPAGGPGCGEFDDDA